MLKHRNHNVCQGKNNFYSYNAFRQVLYPGFGTTGDITTRKREIVAFFAQTSHEITGEDDLQQHMHGVTASLEGNSPGDYCTQSSQWPCVPSKKYFGRGPIQLTR
ncbi:hypothetical protein KY285_024916 [Solanum tuberosum]|nr:hypothetical protein KY285_024916 [Solanum tuberosum]